MYKIDIHVHTRAFNATDRVGKRNNRATAEELMDMYKILKVDKAVILPVIAPEFALRYESHEDIIEICEKYPETFYWFCNIDPREGGNSPDTNFSYFLDYYVEKGAKGIGEITSNLYFDDPRVLNLFKHVEKKGIPLTFHMAHKMYDCYGLIDDLGMPRLEKALQMFPGLKFLAHSQTFWAHMSSDVTEESRQGYPVGKVTPGRVYELMKKYPNLLGDLSAGSGHNAITRDPEFGYAFLEEFNERLFFGTDICAPSNYTYAFFGFSLWFDNALENGKISKKAYENICRNNALKLLGEEIL